MSYDYLVPLVIAVASLAAWATLLWRAWLQRPGAALMQKSPALRNYRPERREAYHLSSRAVWFALLASVLGALGITLALAAWLPLPPLEKALVATLALPLLWPILLVLLVTQVSRPWYFLCLVAGALLLSAGALAPAFGL